MISGLALRARRVVTPDGERPATVVVVDGKIAAVMYGVTAELPAGCEIVDLADDEVLLPGLVDTHVHINDPGRAEWEGFATATRAAAAGGVTTLVDMPLNSLPPTITVAALDLKRAATVGRIHVDVGFWAGAVPGNRREMAGLHKAGVFGFKSFTIDSGVEEFGHLDHDQLAVAVREVAELDAVLIVHAENPASIGPAHGPRFADFLASRPKTAENTAIAELLDLAGKFDARVHVLHLSSAEALPMIRAARERGVRVTAETCPHYLVFRAEDIPDGATPFKCCPPIRESANQDQLWQGLADDTIDLVVSDHSPATVALKSTGDFGTAWGGIAGLQLGLSAVWTQARRRGHPLTDVISWMARRPADFVGLGGKGRIEVGADADLCAFAPDADFIVDAKRLHHRNPVSPYDGLRLTGVVRRTWLRGVPVTGDDPAGRLLRRSA
jgi:allantoinase